MESDPVNKPDHYTQVICENPIAHRRVSDPVNKPAHYNSHPSGVEAITITEGFSFNLGNVVKYVWRAGIKNPDPLEDLRKAQYYLAREIERLQKHGS